MCQNGFSVRYAPGKACQINVACIVLHNIAVKLRLPVPDDDGEDPADDDNNDDGEDPADDDNNDGGNNNGYDPTLSGRATRYRLVQRYFSGY